MLTVKVAESDDLDSFVTDFQKWKTSIGKLQQNRAKLSEDLSSEKRFKVRLKENEDVLTAEILQMKSAISSLHQTLSNLHHVEEENKNLKAKIQKLGEENEKASKAHENEVKFLQAKIQEITLHYTQEIEKVYKELQESAMQLQQVYEEKLSKKDEEIVKLYQEMEANCEARDREKLDLHLEYQLKLSRMEKLVQSAQKPQTSTAQQIFREKLQHIQNRHASELASLRHQMGLLQEEVNHHRQTSEQPIRKQPRASKNQAPQVAKPPTSHAIDPYYEDATATTEKTGKPVKPTFKKRKLFQNNASYLGITED